MVKKLSIIFGIIIIILSIVFFTVYTRPSTMNIVLHDNYIVDTTGLRERWRMTEDSPLIFFMQFTVLEGVEAHILKEHRFEINDLDIDRNRYIVITIGRSLEEIGYQREIGDKTARAEITFSEEHTENMMYIYVTDRVFLADSLTGKGRTTFYIMNCSGREFLGHSLFDFNERELRLIPIE
jgi:hypothetical protein